jgi:hypothetical protein
MKVLLHCCCGPCAVYPVDALRAEGHDLAMFFDNPNIHPYQEYERRLTAAKTLAERRGVPLLVEGGYDVTAWLRKVVFREADRCRICYHDRLTAAARAAKSRGFDAFTSSLLYSKRQNHELCRELAEAAAEEAGTSFLYRDFRAGWKAGIALAKEMGLYRQHYCGCVYSEQERWLGRPGPGLSAEGSP